MARHDLRVLVIDDYADVVDTFAELLGTWGYLVERATSGSEGLGVFIDRAPDVVVLEVALDDVDGCELIGRMRAKAISPVSIIVYSAFDRLRISALAAGADDFVLKPNLGALERAVRRVAASESIRPRRRRKNGKDA